MFISIVILLLAGCMTMLFYNDPGYVMIAFHTATIELPLWLAIAIIFALAIIAILFKKITNLFCQIIKFPKKWQQRVDQRNFQEALLELACGNWKKAEKKARSSTKYSTAPIINYLVASYAATALGAYGRANKYLALAKQCNIDNKYSSAIAISNKWLENAQSKLNSKQLGSPLSLDNS